MRARESDHRAVQVFNLIQPKESFMKKSLFILLVLSTLSACNTISGMGRDVEAAGEAITGTSEKTKQKMN